MTRRLPIMLGVATLMAVGVAGCVTERPELETPVAAGDTIRFSAGPCFGVCPSYSLTVTPDGSGLLEPQRFTAVPGPTRFTVSMAEYRRFRTALLPYKPAAGTTKSISHGQNCERFATDMPGYAIEWSRANAEPTRLEYQSGCMDARYGKLRTTIAAIPRMLGVEAMVKPVRK
ncbi:MAG: DUF6438 domain-containing protein [Sphingobium sp.]